MDLDQKENNIQKFLALDPEKRDRIINAALKEFRYGYKKASTDVIVKAAGISKGLLFHYFGTKENLYKFLGDYTNDIFHSHYYEMLNIGQKDILEAFWQSALLKRDITSRYPYIYDFADGANAHSQDIPKGLIEDFIRKNEDDFNQVLESSDLGLFRDDIDATKAIDLIFFGVEGFFEYARVTRMPDYEKFLEELRSYLDIFRQCFYK